MPTLKQYWNGNDTRYPKELTAAIQVNAEELVRRLNQLCVALQFNGIALEAHPRTGTIFSSGWRPPEVNSITPGAAVCSLHMTGEAADLYDPEGAIDDFLMAKKGQALLEGLGLWLEHPSATKGWCHVQTRPPRSGRRVFYP